MERPRDAAQVVLEAWIAAPGAGRVGRRHADPARRRSIRAACARCCARPPSAGRTAPTWRGSRPGSSGRPATRPPPCGCSRTPTAASPGRRCAGSFAEELPRGRDRRDSRGALRVAARRWPATPRASPPTGCRPRAAPGRSRPAAAGGRRRDRASRARSHDVPAERWGSDLALSVARALRQAGRTAEARALLGRLGASTTSPELALERALTELRDGPPSGARRRSRRSRTRSQEAAFHYAEALFFAGHTDSALAWYQRVCHRPAGPFDRGGARAHLPDRGRRAANRPAGGRAHRLRDAGAASRSGRCRSPIRSTARCSHGARCGPTAALELAALREETGDAARRARAAARGGRSLPEDRLAPLARQRAGDVYRVWLKDDAQGDSRSTRNAWRAIRARGTRPRCGARSRRCAASGGSDRRTWPDRFRTGGVTGGVRRPPVPAGIAGRWSLVLVLVLPPARRCVAVGHRCWRCAAAMLMLAAAPRPPPNAAAGDPAPRAGRRGRRRERSYAEIVEALADRDRCWPRARPRRRGSPAPARRQAAGADGRAARPITSRPTASPTGCWPAGRRAEWLLNYRGGSFLLADDRRDRARGQRARRHVRADRRRRRGRDPRRDRRQQHGVGRAREGAEGRRLHPAQHAAVGRRGDAGARVRRHPLHQGVGRGGAERRALEVRLAPPPPRGLHRPARQVLRRLPQLPLVPGGGARCRRRWRPSSASPRSPQLKARGGAGTIKDYVGRGGFMFGMCSATDTYDIALAAEGVDIADVGLRRRPARPAGATASSTTRARSRSRTSGSSWIRSSTGSPTST